MKNLKMKMAIMEAHGSQIELAKKIGMTEDALSRIVNGWRVPNADDRARLLKVFSEARLKELLDEKPVAKKKIGTEVRAAG